jgi:hypothetical protein
VRPDRSHVPPSRGPETLMTEGRPYQPPFAVFNPN